MLSKFYDENGKLINFEQRQFKSKERLENIFSKIIPETDFQHSCQYNTTDGRIKRKVRVKSDEKVMKSKKDENFGGIDFQIPDLVVESENSLENYDVEGDGKKIPEEDGNRISVVEKKKVYKLQIGVADFAKKVKDNEGMGISTFSIDEEEEEFTSNAKSNSNDQNNLSTALCTLRSEHFINMCQIAKVLRREKLRKTEKPLQRFLNGIRIIMLLLKTCRTSSQQTERNNKKYLTFADYHENEDDRKSSGMFDIKLYKAKKESTLGPEAIEIMRMNPSLRTPEMIRTALVSINATVEIFGEFPLSMQTSLVNKGWYEKFESKRTIIRQGHKALNYYFIISGTTTVSVARTNKATGETYSETVAFLKKGNSFGELALMFGGKRSATVSCKTDVELLAVSRDDFIDIFMSISSHGEPEHIRFLRNLPLLSQWPIDELPYDDPSICLFTYFRRGTVLCHDSNAGNWVYIVKSGKCRIIKLIHLNQQDQKDKIKLLKEYNQYFEFLSKDSNYEKQKQSKNEIPPPKVKVTRELNGKYYIQLKILNVGSIFGLEPMAFEFVGGTTDVTLVSDGAELVAIERKFFQKHMSREYQSWLRKELHPFPSIESLIAKLKNFYHWKDYRESIIKSAII